MVFGRPATLDRYTMVVRDLRSLLLFPGYEKVRKKPTLMVFLSLIFNENMITL